MYEAMVLLAVVFMFVSGIDYARRAWIKQTTPVLATWILMMIMMILSFSMYWTSPNRSWSQNIAVTSGAFNVAIILGGVIASQIRYGTLEVAFTKIQKWCLVLGGGVVVFWFFTSDPLISYILVQSIALIAYVATVKKLWDAEGSSEPLIDWVLIFVGTLCAVYPAYTAHDLFSYIYLGRALPSGILVIYLIARAQQRVAIKRS